MNIQANTILIDSIKSIVHSHPEQLTNDLLVQVCKQLGTNLPTTKAKNRKVIKVALIVIKTLENLIKVQKQLNEQNNNDVSHATAQTA